MKCIVVWTAVHLLAKPWLTAGAQYFVCRICFFFSLHSLFRILNLNAVKRALLSVLCNYFFFSNRKTWDQCRVKGSQLYASLLHETQYVVEFFYVALFKFVSTQHECTPLIGPNVSICEQHFIHKHRLRGWKLFLKLKSGHVATCFAGKKERCFLCRMPGLISCNCCALHPLELMGKNTFIKRS